MGAKFMLPHEVPTIPGTEGWERMYPYYYRFSKDDPKRAEHEKNQFWFYDGLHYPEPHYPFDVIMDEAWYLACSQANTRLFLVPPANGIDHRILNGYIYVSGLTVADPEEIQRRVPIFMKRAGHYYQNWDKLYGEWKVKMDKLHADLAAVRFEALPKMEDEMVVFENTGLGSGYHLLNKYDELINMATKVWQYHFEFLNLGYAAYVTFINTAMSIFPDIPVQTLTKMVSGIDVVMYRPDAELIRLAKLAIETKLDVIFEKRGLDAAAVMKEMADTLNGRYWLDELEKARYPWFYISTGTGWYHHHYSWNDNLNVPFDSIRMHIEALKAGKQVGRPTEKVAEERDAIIAEYRSLIGNDADLKAFDDARDLSAKVFPYVEDHLFYVEHWFHSVFWSKIRQVAAILAQAGFIEDKEDVWYLTRGEIRDALWDYVCNWACDTRPEGQNHWPKEIEWRKGVMEKFRQWQNPPAIGTPPEVVTEPFTIALFGVTTETVKGWLKGMEPGGDEDNEIMGLPGSPGIVKGKARVIRSVGELADLQEGEILVAPTTSPSWAPAFTKIGGAVTDVGGVMCHAAIVCREYALPTVVGTGRGTVLIKTGDLIQIDGDEGSVKILQRA